MQPEEISITLDLQAAKMIRKITDYRRQEAEEQGEPAKEESPQEILTLALAEYMKKRGYLDRWQQEIAEEQDGLIAVMKAITDEQGREIAREDQHNKHKG